MGPPLSCLLVAALRGEAGLVLDCYSSLLQVHLLPREHNPMDVLQTAPLPAAPSSLPEAGLCLPLGSLAHLPRGAVEAVRPAASTQWLQCRACGAECRGGPRCQGCGGRRADWRLTLVVRLGGSWVRLGEATARSLLPGSWRRWSRGTWRAGSSGPSPSSARGKVSPWRSRRCSVHLDQPPSKLNPIHCHCQLAEILLCSTLIDVLP